MSNSKDGARGKQQPTKLLRRGARVDFTRAPRAYGSCRGWMVDASLGWLTWLTWAETAIKYYFRRALLVPDVADVADVAIGPEFGFEGPGSAQRLSFFFCVCTRPDLPRNALFVQNSETC